MLLLAKGPTTPCCNGPSLPQHRR